MGDRKGEGNGKKRKCGKARERGREGEGEEKKGKKDKGRTGRGIFCRPVIIS